MPLSRPFEARRRLFPAQEPQRIRGYEHGCARISENSRPQTRHSGHRRREKHRLEAKRDGDVLMDVAHGPAGEIDHGGDIPDPAVQHGGVSRF